MENNKEIPKDCVCGEPEYILLGIRRRLFKKSDDASSEQMREMHEDEFEAHRAINEAEEHTYKGASGLRVKTFIPETIEAIRMMVQEWVNMHQGKCRGTSEGEGPENQREFWVARNRNNDNWVSRKLPSHAVIVGWSS